MSFERPAFLLLFALIPAAVYLTVHSRSRIGLRRKLIASTLRVAALLSITAGLAGIALGPSRDLSTVFLVDASDSILLAQQVEQTEWVRSAIENADPNSRSAVVQFSNQARVAALPERSGSDLTTYLSLGPEVSGDTTDYANALLTGLALVGQGNAGRLILLSDGKPNAGDLEQAVDRLKAEDVPVYVRPVVDLGNADVALESAASPATVRQGQSFEVQVVAVSRRRTEARLRLWTETELVADNLIELEVGSNPFSVRVPARGVGIQSMRVELLDDSDQELGNNVLETFTRVLPPPRVLIIGTPDDTNAPAGVMRQAGLAVSTGTAASLPSSYEGLTRYETVFLSNVPGESLTDEQQRALRDHVAAGRGLIVAGGNQSFGAGGYSDHLMDDILPVRSSPPEDEDKGIAIILAIDRSTSMSYENEGLTKMDMAKEAAVQAIDLLKEGDRIGIIAFDDNTEWVSAPRTVSTAADLRTLISRIRSMEIGGGTDIYTALQTARRRLRTLDAGVKHVILITDGQASYGEFDLFGQQVRRDAISVSTIGIGTDADLDLLEKIARDGEGRHYFAADPSTIPAVLTKETELAQSFYVVNRRHQPRLLSPSPIFQSASSDATLPFLEGFVRTKAKPTAEIVLASDSNDPILATWQLGLGRVVAWTSDTGGEWSEEWSSWTEFSNVLTGMVFWASSGAAGSESGLTINAEQRGENVHLAVDSTDRDGNFRNLLPTRAVISPPVGPRIDLDLRQTEPGRYEVSFPTAGPGLYRMAVVQEDGQSTIGPELAGVVVPYSPELRLRDSGPSVLSYIAESTGGGLIENSSDAIPRPPLGHAEALAPLLITVGMILFLLDVAVRRVRSGRSEMRGQYRDTLEWIEDRTPRKLMTSGVSILRQRFPFSR
ncbi:MAG: VWA domain-containing protein [Chloroflexi bacterium]|nr:VWA domain-containing protein [Chloroflexota bacterium]MCY3937115.1 VWA domain-containing protein [Chloroflexota bacterium]